MAAENYRAPSVAQSAELAEQQGVEVQLPEFGINTANHAGIRIRGYTADQMRDYARAALAATGKQQFTHVRQVKEHFNLPLTTEQVGEVKGDARRILAKHMRRIAAAHNVPRLATEADIVEGGEEYDFWMDAAYAAVREALAARQPGAQEQAADFPLTLRGLIAYGHPAGNPGQGATPSFMCDLIRQMIPHLKRLDALDSVPPAQGIDLPQLRSLLVRINEDDDGDSYHNLSCDALDLIDQRDAATGVGS